MYDLEDIVNTTQPLEPAIQGTMKEWTLAPSGEYVGVILGDDGGVYTAGSWNCVPSGSGITAGSRVRFRPHVWGQSKDKDTGAPYPYGTAREISLVL